MARIKVTAAARRNASKTRILEALRNAGTPVLLDRNRAYFIGTDSKGVELEIILVADDDDPETWVAIHAMPTHYRDQ